MVMKGGSYGGVVWELWECGVVALRERVVVCG